MTERCAEADRVGSHWVGCWQAHHSCAIAIIEQVLDVLDGTGGPLDGLASLPSDPRDLVSPEDRARVQANLEEMARQRQRAESHDGEAV